MAKVPPETVPVSWSVWTSLVPTARLGMTSADDAGLLAEVDERDAAEVLDLLAEGVGRGAQLAREGGDHREPATWRCRS